MPHDITFVVANRDSGKTTNLKNMLRSQFPQAKVCGVLSLANDEKTCYRLKDLVSGDERRVMDTQAIEGAYRFSRFFVDQKVFDWANASIIDNLDCCELAVFDEIGKIELLGGGLCASFKAALGNPSIRILAAVRIDFVPEVLTYFGLQHGEVVMHHCL